ncbi:hypothetical protein HNO53_12895 [Billgrantia antri]|uniref:Bacteriophage tail tape measure C-terminal domain-containing protein n=1 Tax=Halomonas sulfidivorans TaxID=2733488 RepID=A0ABX7WK55_9GAMM|nr:phage tail tape measure C-terminal domain-containing protein [Halomonas sulfidivorans]QTP59533.1 hypothetical protein HNO53_12895 [Halomonas sulfidivorans]
MANKAVELLINLKTAGTKEIDKLIKSIGSVSNTAKSSAGGFDKLDKEIKETSGSSRKLGQTAKQLDGNLEKQSRSAKKAADSVDKLNKEVKTGSAVSGAMNTGVSKLRGGLVGLAAAAAAAVAGMAGLSQIKDRSREMIQMANAAERLGMSMEEFTAAEAAASQAAGLNWENLKDGLDDLNERIVDFAKNGAGEAADLFAQFEQLDPTKMMNMDGLDQLRAVTDAMKDLSTQERSQLLDQLGSDNLRELTNVLEGSNAEFFQMIENAKEAGLTISSLEADRISSIGKDVNDLGRNFGILRDKFLAKISPAIEVIVEHINDLIGGMEKSADEGGSMAKAVITGVEFIIGAYNKWRGINKILSTAVLGLFHAVVSGAGLIVKAYDGMVNTVVNGAFATLEGGLRIAGKLSDTAKQMADDIANYKPKQNNNGAMLDAMGEEIKKKAQEAWKEGQEYLNKDVPPLSAKLDVLLEEQRARRAAKDAADEAQNEADRNPVNLTITAEAQKAMKALAEARENNEAEAQKSITRQRIRDMEHEQDVALKNLESQKNAGELGSAQYYAKRLELEKSHNAQVAEMRQRLIDMDIEAVKRQRDALSDMLGSLEQGSAEYLSTVQKIEEAEARIKGLKFEAENIDLASQYKNELLVIADAERQREALRKESEKVEKESEEKRKEAAEQVAKQEKMVADLKLDLLRQTGNEADAQIVELKNKYGDMLTELEGNSEGAQLIEKLLDMKTAQVQLDEFKKQLEDLRAAYDLGEISRSEYNSGVEALTPDLNAAAIRTGNEEIIDSTKRMAEEYRNFGDVAYQVGDVVGNRFMGLTDGLHSVIMGTKSLKDAFHEMAAGIIADLLKMIIQQQIFNALQAAGSAIGGGFGSALSSVGMNHTGGYIGAGSARRSVPMSLFAGAPEFHDGGLIGADEVPIIAQKGEYVLDKYDIRNPKNGGNGYTPGGSGAGQQAVNITNVVDSASIAGAMDTPDGRNAIVNVIRAERATIKSIL